jgi:hypothetical protein
VRNNVISASGRDVNGNIPTGTPVRDWVLWDSGLSVADYGQRMANGNHWWVGGGEGRRSERRRRRRRCVYTWDCCCSSAEQLQGQSKLML